MVLAVVLRVRGLLVPPWLLDRDFFMAAAAGICSLLAGSCWLEKTGLGGSQCLSTDQWVTLGRRWRERMFCTTLRSATTSPLRELLRMWPTYLESHAFQVEIESGQERGMQNKSRLHLLASWTDWIAALCKPVRAPEWMGHMCASAEG